MAEDQVDLCLGEVMQDVAEDNISPSEVQLSRQRSVLRLNRIVEDATELSADC